MANVIKKTLLVIVALIILLVVAAVSATLILDPNDYKPQIEAAVEKNTHLQLDLNGPIDWSLIPIGLELQDVEAQLEDKRLVKLDNLVAQVDFWSLITFSPSVDTFVLDGLEANLVRNKAGQGNWERIMPEKTGGEAAPEPQPTPQKAGGSPLQFEVQEVQIANAVVHYTDEASGQSISLDEFNLSAQDITLGSDFPLALSFHLATGKPQIDINGELSASLSGSESLKIFTVKNLQSNFTLQGEPISGEKVTAALSGDLAANLEQETATIKGLKANIANAELATDLSVNGFGDKMALEGQLNLTEFSLRQLLDQLGQPPIETRDPEVLDKVALSTRIGGPAGMIKLSDFALTLDETKLTGGLQYGLADSFVGVDLTGNRLNLDRYLPPKKEETGTQESEQPAPTEKADTAAAAPQPEGDLLPLETIRKLALDIQLKLNELVASNLKMNDIGIKVTGKDGLIKVEQFGGQLYQGKIGASATLDARKDTPTWQISEEIHNVQVMPLLTDLAQVKLLSGGVNQTAEIKTSGNKISVLRENAAGQIDFNMAEGAFEGMNLTHMACQGIALANQDSLSKTDWANKTPFDNLSGKMVINGNTLKNTSLVAALSGLKLEGEGTVDLKQLMMDYRAGLRVVGEIEKDPACRVNERVQDVVIPVECKGSLIGEPAKLCSFDGSRFRDTLKDIVKSEAKRKARKEIEDKVGDKLDEKLGGEAGKEIKDKLKGLFQ
ncbi:AsmA family protein [Marinobacteraceae bacterium S3BR75-40.1]